MLFFAVVLITLVILAPTIYWLVGYTQLAQLPTLSWHVRIGAGIVGMFAGALSTFFIVHLYEQLKQQTVLIPSAAPAE